jgi:hypothetical protein
MPTTPRRYHDWRTCRGCGNRRARVLALLALLRTVPLPRDMAVFHARLKEKTR